MHCCYRPLCTVLWSENVAFLLHGWLLLLLILSFFLSFASCSIHCPKKRQSIVFFLTKQLTQYLIFITLINISFLFSHPNWSVLTFRFSLKGKSMSRPDLFSFSSRWNTHFASAEDLLFLFIFLRFYSNEFLCKKKETSIKEKKSISPSHFLFRRKTSKSGDRKRNFEKSSKEKLAEYNCLLVFLSSIALVAKCLGRWLERKHEFVPRLRKENVRESQWASLPVRGQPWLSRCRH